MTQLATDGFEDIRSYIQTNWPFIAIVDANGNEVTRIDVPNDARASWSSGSSTNPLEATITLTGSDSDITLPVTIDTTESYKSSGATTVMGSDTFADATLQNSGDELTITHQISLPL